MLGRLSVWWKLELDWGWLSGTRSSLSYQMCFALYHRGLLAERPWDGEGVKSGVGSSVLGGHTQS